MGDIILNNNTLVYKESENIYKTILQMNNCIYNKSSIPFHVIYTKGNDKNVIFDFLYPGTFASECININKRSSEIYNTPGIITELNSLCTFLTARFCTHKAVPSNIALLNCEESLLYSVLSVIGLYNQETNATLVQNEILNNGDNYFLSVLLNIERAPSLSLHVCDYYKLGLQSDNMDFIVVNGNILRINTEETLKELNRIYNGKGNIIYILNDQPETIGLIQKIHGESEIYNISDELKVISVSSKAVFKKKTVISEKYAHLNYLDKFDLPDDNIRNIIKEIEKDIDIFIKEYDIEQKIRCIELKEYLISYMLFEEYKEYYSEQIKKLLSADK